MLLIILFTGLCFGSFITMASYRLALVDDPKNKSTIKDLIFKRSFCPNCNKKLKIRHLFPIFSWLFFAGKCGLCKNKIHYRYPLIEIATAFLFLIIFLSLGSKIDIKFILISLMAVSLMIMIVVDLENYFIPNITQIILAILVFTYHLIISELGQIPYYLFSSLGFFLFGIVIHYAFWFFSKKQGIGEDDLKFFAIAGMMLGIKNLMLFMMFSGILGTIFGLFWTKIKKDSTFPFAPALCCSFLILTMYQIDYIEIFGNVLYLFQKYITKTAY